MKSPQQVIDFNCFYILGDLKECRQVIRSTNLTPNKFGIFSIKLFLNPLVSMNTGYEK